MSNLNIANRYANALMQLAEDKNAFDSVSADVELVYNTLKSSRELQVALSSPVISQKDKKSILTQVFENRISPESMEFIQFVVQKNREDLIFNIASSFLILRDKKMGIVNAEVISSYQLNDEQKNKLKSKIEEITRKKVRLTYSVRESIIGGFMIRIEDTIYDASIKHRLEALREKLLKGDLSLN